MTRINLVPPEMLSNQHLLAEYRELPRIFTAVKKKNITSSSIENLKIPEDYVLGKGHCLFFYNKLFWLLERYNSLFNQLECRNYNLNKEKYNKICSDAMDLMTENDGSLKKYLTVGYTPKIESIYLNMYRISIRHFKLKDELNKKRPI